eukprot:CAMPEP_0185749518 /NCGR_PEP_ID=MMETSP1174-20130828/8217_1 /TAXON_ID=35687 /ORGANISM="Dictyocha speculum, Strain CCMP1381" /LENGTH=60 /DNA_ID=CAMNT_0028425655 /DNA_START=133 /DNA_END=315 /DNA_ORIENTATION=+
MEIDRRAAYNLVIPIGEEAFLKASDVYHCRQRVLVTPLQCLDCRAEADAVRLDSMAPHFV